MGPDFDPYSILGILRDASATAIKKAYRVLAKTYHPDNGSAPDAEAMGLVSRAYAVLTDPELLAAFLSGSLGKPTKLVRLENMATMYLFSCIQSTLNDQAFGNVRVMAHFDRHIQAKKAEMSNKLSGKEQAVRRERQHKVNEVQQQLMAATRAGPLLEKFANRLSTTPENDRLGTVLKQMAEEQQKAQQVLADEVKRLEAAVDDPVPDDVEMVEMREMVEACDLLASWLSEYTFKDPTPEMEAAFMAQMRQRVMGGFHGFGATSSTASFSWG
jgi:hypothetical protein